MDEFTDRDFLKFLEYYEKRSFTDEKGNIHNFHDSITELSRSESEPYDALINCDFPMFSLDWMVKASKKWRDTSKRCLKIPKLCEHKFPKTIDALYCGKNQIGNLVLHIIEFKFIPSESNKIKLDNLFQDIVEKNNQYEINKAKNKDSENKKCFDNKFVDDFKDVRKDYIDNIEYSLQLKPYESVFIALPGLYEEYCDDEGEPKKDFRSYLANMEKYYWVCIDTGIDNGDHLQRQAKHYEQYYQRMVPSIFKEANARTRKNFEINLKENILFNVSPIEKN